MSWVHNFIAVFCLQLISSNIFAENLRTVQRFFDIASTLLVRNHRCSLTPLRKTCLISVIFADVSGCSDVGKIGWGQLQLLHSASQRLQSPSEPLPTPLRSLHHPSESYNYMSMDDKRPLTPSGSEIERKYQRMLAVVEER